MKTKSRKARNTVYSNQPQYTHDTESRSSFSGERNYMRGNSSIGDRSQAYPYQRDHDEEHHVGEPDQYNQRHYSFENNSFNQENPFEDSWNQHQNEYPSVDNHGRSDLPRGMYRNKHSARQNASRWAHGRSWDSLPNDWNNRNQRPEEIQDKNRDSRFRHEDRMPPTPWWAPHSDDYDYPSERREPYYDQHKGKGPKGYQRSDIRIQEDISDRLSDDGRVDASDIVVSVERGEVMLTGTVASKFDKRRAEDVSENISGVKNVENRIRIRIPQQNEYGSRSTPGESIFPANPEANNKKSKE